MLTGNLVRVKHARHKITPVYLDPTNRGWLTLAEQLLLVYRESVGRTRGEIEADLEGLGLVGEGQAFLVHQGLAKLLDDRCDYEVSAEVSPEAVREAVFAAAAQTRKAGTPFDRERVLAEVAPTLGLTPVEIERTLFADLKDEQRVLKFADGTPEQLLHRYNVALAQAMLLKCVGMEVRVWNETPARFRKLFRAVKFHRLMGTIRSNDGNSFTLALDGPLSLFTSTQKYGLQLALFLPTLLQCKTFDLKADLLWGADKKPKTFTLSGSDGLRSHLPDFGVHTPREIENLMENLRTSVPDWVLSDDPHPVPIEGTTWVPDFQITHNATGTVVFVEVVGYWRKLDLESHYRRLQRAIPGKFVLAVGEQYRADEGEDWNPGPGVYRFKRTPIAAEVAKMAAAVARV